MKTIPRNCKHCGKKFDAQTKGKYSPGDYCKECVKKKVWMRRFSYGSEDKA